ncbi:MAG: hypothetical protein Q8N26_05435 [Myxococcales bacterium]|nr:hypothetical protein [Myxococcales bacterium]
MRSRLPPNSSTLLSAESHDIECHARASGAPATIRCAQVLPVTSYAQVWLLVPANVAFPPKRYSDSAVLPFETSAAPVRADGRVAGFKLVMVGGPATAPQVQPTVTMKNHRTLEV